MEGLPVKLWGLDPLYWSHIKLFIIEIFELPRYPGFQGVYAINNHPIVKAEVMGYVVKVERKQMLTVYGVDDGTASIPCCHWVEQDEISDNRPQPNLGDMVTVLGKITTFREQRQITISTICIEKDPNVEILHWLEVLKNKETYNRPFEIPTQLNPKVPSVNKYSLKTPLDVEINSLEEALKLDIKDYLDSKNIQSFHIDSLCSVTKLKEKTRMLSNKYGESFKEPGTKESKESSDETKCIIRRTLRKMEKEGIVYCKNVFDGYFEVISVKNDLSPRIIRVIEDISENEGEASCGVSRGKIIQKLKSLEKYKYVRRDTVTLALDNLLVSGDIYETKDYHYRLV